MKKNIENNTTEANASAPNSGNRRKKKRGRKAASATKAATRSNGSNAATIKLIAQASKALDRATTFLGKIKF